MIIASVGRSMPSRALSLFPIAPALNSRVPQAASPHPSGRVSGSASPCRYADEPRPYRNLRAACTSSDSSQRLGFRRLTAFYCLCPLR
ncbi:hypothetical protein DPEC_G00125190 [Dallia pectoralis]|uniref:Uncharacterized protein n=1 Tax=Dallia pectoralis TaxID=75939 RepID=A0ACC2GR47_DALPE|nr:hypothetical protein DPEC_G00125190 [Dallia pectoralis]